MFKRMKIGLRLGLGFGVIIALLIVSGVFAFTRLLHLDAAMGDIVRDKYPQTVLAHDIMNEVNIIARALRNAVMADDPGVVRQELQRLAEQRQIIAKKVDQLTKLAGSEEGKARLQAMLEAQKQYEPVQSEITQLIESGKKDQAKADLFTRMRPVQAKYLQEIENLIAFQANLMDKTAKDAEATSSTARNLIIFVLLISMVLAATITLLVTRSITKPINQAVQINERLAEGDLSLAIEVDRDDETGRMLAAMKNTIEKIKEISSDINLLTAAATEGKLAYRADADKHQGDFRKIVEGINLTLDAFIGPLNVSAEYVDRISKGDIPAKITDEYKGDFNEIKNNLNNCLDNINALIADANALAVAAVEGNLGTRADAAKHHGDFRKIIQGVNRAIDSIVGHLDSMPAPALIVDREFTIKYINEVGASLTGLSPQALVGTKCYDHFKTPDCRTARCACAQCMEQGREATAETDAHPQGQRFDISYTGVPIKDLDGKIIGALEIITDLTAVKKAARLARKQAEYQAAEVDKLVVNLGKVAQGDLQIDTATGATDEDTRAAGENFRKINAGLAGTIKAISDLVEDADALAQAAVEGKLATRADAAKHGGDYGKIIDGVNRTLDAVIGPLNVSAEYVDRISKGDIPAKITDDYRGDFNEIKNNLNNCIDNINALIADADALALAAVAGKCATSALGIIGGVRNCTRDGGRPPGAGLQEQAPNHLKLRWLRARVVSVKDKSWLKTVAGEVQGDEQPRTTDEVSKH